jgi:RHS repeat-associated protein
MIDDGAGKTFQWDAENRLIKISYAGSGSTEFTYNGLSQRVKIVEKNSGGGITSTKNFVWCGGNQPCEERDGSNVVTKRFYAQGVQVPSASSPADKLFYTRDHLGSVRELVDSDEVVRGRWDYDPYGKRSANLITSGALSADMSHTGHYYHENSGLYLTWYRAYDPELGKWISRDPIEEDGGINLYSYVKNSPIKFYDPAGLKDYDMGCLAACLGDAAINYGIGMVPTGNLTKLIGGAGVDITLLQFAGGYDNPADYDAAGLAAGVGDLLRLLADTDYKDAGGDNELQRLQQKYQKKKLKIKPNDFNKMNKLLGLRKYARGLGGLAGLLNLGATGYDVYQCLKKCECP